MSPPSFGPSGRAGLRTATGELFSPSGGFALAYSRVLRSRWMHACRPMALLGVVAMLVLAPPRPAQSLKLNASVLKVAMVGRIAEFVRWPASAGLDDPDRPFELVLLGSSPLEAHFASYYSQVRIA